MVIDTFFKLALENPKVWIKGNVYVLKKENKLYKFLNQTIPKSKEFILTKFLGFLGE